MAYSLPPVGALFNDTWRVIQKTWLQQLGLLFMQVVFSGILLVVFLVSIVMLAAGTAGLSAATPEASLQLLEKLASSGAITIAVLLFFVLVLASVFIQSVFQAATIALIDNAYQKGTKRFGDFFHTGFSKALPLYFTTLLGGLLILGGFYLFFFPAIIFGLLFMFSGIEIVLSKEGPVEALRESARIVSNSFIAIVGRLLLVVLIGSVIQIIMTALVDKGGLFEALIYLALFLFYTFASIAYPLVIYRQAKDAAQSAPKFSLKPIVITSIIGYVVGILIFGLIISLTMSSGMMDALNQGFSQGFNRGQRMNNQLNMQKEVQQNIGVTEEMMRSSLRQSGVDPDSAEGKAALEQYQQMMQQLNTQTGSGAGVSPEINQMPVPANEMPVPVQQMRKK